MDPRAARVLLVETADRVLTTFPPSLSAKAAASLETLGVTPLLGHTVVDIIDGELVRIQTPDLVYEDLQARTVIWAAGVTASALAGELANAAGTEVDRAGRLTVGPQLTIPGHPRGVCNR